MNKIPFPTAVLFDFDGVIVDSVKSHHTAWKSAFSEMFDIDIDISLRTTHAGIAPIKVAEILADLGGDVTRALELNELKLAYLLSQDRVPTLLPGVVELQQFFMKRSIPYGIASNAYTSYLKRTITQLSLDFEVFMGIDLFDLPKPSPSPYLTLAKKIGVEEKDFSTTLIFEDSLTGIRAARDSGMLPIGIMTQCSEVELKENGAIFVFPTLKEVYKELKRFY